MSKSRFPLIRCLPGALTTGCIVAMLAGTIGQAADAQTPGGSSPTTGSIGGSSGANSSAVQQAQQQLGAASGQSTSGATQDNFKGSIVQGKSTGTTIDLTLDDAIQRGLRQNLGIILSSSTVQNANGQRLEQLQQLLPTITAQGSITIEQINLAAYGLKFPGLNPIIGPFQVVDFRAYLTQKVLDISALQNYLQSKHNFQGTKLTAQDARDMVTLTVGNAYLLCIADQARIEAVQAQLATAKVSLDQANANHDAGTSPKLDVLRAQVDYQNEQQTLISTTNTLAKDNLALARTIGLPLDQAFRLTDKAPYAALDNVDAQQAFEQAVKTRKDIAGYEEQLKAAEAGKKAARATQYPAASISGDFGDIGTTVGHSHGTYTATGQVTAPILQIAKTRGAEQVAAANYDNVASKLSDQIQQVNQDIRSSILDIQAAAKLVEATQSNVALATEELSEAQQRFRAGVADTLPVSQAQSQSEQANDQYISALYQHNVAKLSLARAIGVAETSYKTYLGGK